MIMYPSLSFLLGLALLPLTTTLASDWIIEWNQIPRTAVVGINKIPETFQYKKRKAFPLIKQSLPDSGNGAILFGQDRETGAPSFIHINKMGRVLMHKIWWRYPYRGDFTIGWTKTRKYLFLFSYNENCFFILNQKTFEVEEKIDLPKTTNNPEKIWVVDANRILIEGSRSPYIFDLEIKKWKRISAGIKSLDWMGKYIGSYNQNRNAVFTSRDGSIVRFGRWNLSTRAPDFFMEWAHQFYERKATRKYVFWQDRAFAITATSRRFELEELLRARMYIIKDELRRKFPLPKVKWEETTGLKPKKTKDRFPETINPFLKLSQRVSVGLENMLRNLSFDEKKQNEEFSQRYEQVINFWADKIFEFKYKRINQVSEDEKVVYVHELDGEGITLLGKSYYQGNTENFNVSVGKNGIDISLPGPESEALELIGFENKSAPKVTVKWSEEKPELEREISTPAKTFWKERADKITDAGTMIPAGIWEKRRLKLSENNGRYEFKLFEEGLVAPRLVLSMPIDEANQDAVFFCASAFFDGSFILVMQSPTGETKLWRIKISAI